jgi:serine/threonine-protein kinase
LTSPAQSRRALEWFERLAEAGTVVRRRQLEKLQDEEPDLAAAVRDLFAADGEDGLEAPFAPLGTALAPRPPSAGDRLGPYELTRVLGEGGMGTVWEAQRVDGGFEQRVAIKFLHHLGLGLQAERRFLFEREVLGKLRHPAIARILDAGRTPAGAPYLVMEHVDGERIDDYCDRHGCSVGDRVRLVLAICQAVAHAHRNLVVHRDLKPANILVTGEGEPRLLDFGIAKLLADDQRRATFTVEGPGPMTLEYASPEQVRGRPVTTASDVYSLGVVLYRLLTGETPFARSARSPLDLGRSVAEEDARPPSSTAASGRLRRELRGDLDNVALKALQRDPERRYRSVDAFAADLESWLGGLPVTARGDSLAYRSAKFVRRNWLGVAAVALVFVSLAAGMGVATWKAAEAREQRIRADDNAQRTEMVNRFLVDLLAAPGGRWWRDLDDKGPETRVIDLLDEAAARLEDELEGAPLQRATLHQTLNDTFLALGLPVRAEPQVRRALEIRRRELGDIHPAVAESTYYLAATLRSQGRFAAALEVYRDALEIERRLPQPTGNLPYALSEMAGTAARVGLHSEVEGLIRRALDQARTRDPGIEGFLLSMDAVYRAERGELDRAREGLRAADRWLRSAGPELRPPRPRWPRAAVAWLDGDLESAARESGDPASAVSPVWRAQLLYDLGRREEARRLLVEELGSGTSRYPEAEVLSGRLALALDGDPEGCLARVEPALAAEESWSRGPTWYLAEARSALAACLLARGRPGDAARASQLAVSARTLLDALFDRPTPLHRRIERLDG